MASSGAIDGIPDAIAKSLSTKQTVPVSRATMASPGFVLAPFLSYDVLPAVIAKEASLAKITCGGAAPGGKYVDVEATLRTLWRIPGGRAARKSTVASRADGEYRGPDSAAWSPEAHGRGSARGGVRCSDLRPALSVANGENFARVTRAADPAMVTHPPAEWIVVFGAVANMGRFILSHPLTRARHNQERRFVPQAPRRLPARCLRPQPVASGRVPAHPAPRSPGPALTRPRAHPHCDGCCWSYVRHPGPA